MNTFLSLLTIGFKYQIKKLNERNVPDDMKQLRKGEMLAYVKTVQTIKRHEPISDFLVSKISDLETTLRRVHKMEERIYKTGQLVTYQLILRDYRFFECFEAA